MTMGRSTGILGEGLRITACARFLDGFIKILTRRIEILCELTTEVYGSAPSVSRLFCRRNIAFKPLILQPVPLIQPGKIA
jgi:hypothetical protein